MTVSTSLVFVLWFTRGPTLSAVVGRGETDRQGMAANAAWGRSTCASRQRDATVGKNITKRAEPLVTVYILGDAVCVPATVLGAVVPPIRQWHRAAGQVPTTRGSSRVGGGACAPA